MKKINRFATGLATLAVLISAGFTAAPAFAAAPNTCLWTGATNTTFSTATNWSSCGGVAPQAGDIIAFNNTPASATLTNDLGVALGGLQVLGGGASINTFTIDTLTFAPNATVADSASATPGAVTVSGAVIGQGDLLLSSSTGNFGFFGGTWNVAGTVSVTQAQPQFSNLNGGLLRLTNDVPTANFTGTATNGATVSSSENITITSPTSTPGTLFFYNSTSGGTQTYAFSGAVALNVDELVCPDPGVTVTFTGALTTNGHSITKSASAGCGGTVNFNWSSVSVTSAPAGSTAPKAPNTSKTGVSQANIAAPIIGAILVAAGILGVRSLATRKR